MSDGPSHTDATSGGDGPSRSDAPNPARPPDPAGGAPEPEPSHPNADEPPPFLGRWSRLYALVVIGLVLMIALCGWLSRVGR